MDILQKVQKKSTKDTFTDVRRYAIICKEALGRKRWRRVVSCSARPASRRWTATRAAALDPEKCRCIFPFFLEELTGDKVKNEGKEKRDWTGWIFYSGRASCRDCRNRHSGEPSASGSEQGPRPGTHRFVHQQHEAARDGKYAIFRRK